MHHDSSEDGSLLLVWFTACRPAAHHAACAVAPSHVCGNLTHKSSNTRGCDGGIMLLRELWLSYFSSHASEQHHGLHRANLFIWWTPEFDLCNAACTVAVCLAAWRHSLFFLNPLIHIHCWHLLLVFHFVAEHGLQSFTMALLHVLKAGSVQTALASWCRYWWSGAELLACLQAAIGTALFGQQGHTRLNGSREMWYMCQDKLELVTRQFVNVCCSWYVHLYEQVCFLGVAFPDNISERTLAWSPEDIFSGKTKHFLSSHCSTK